ncbi:Ig-like domain-containing protein [Bradymonas sediminis]|uniref:Uncharacterized protein n=1 Tax=Bradymonas sediminis TaxID=1548548 RepID=A0A2Z4FJW8_9DELT|nr:Ig-like domain-containing protein [Bradymonas sediminis]AWV89135.1 hypothetical protein DN745_07210 [Bradymonas sediminis]TDP64399.1 hypothetical protein DFR33_10960 [Bradymonas sediminis]
MSLLRAMSANPSKQSQRSLRGGLALIALLSLAGACVPIEPEALVDSEGEPIEVPGPADRWLQVVGTSPDYGTVDARPTFAFTFNDYLDEDSFKSYNFATLSSGGIRTGGRAFYRMSDKTVVWRPNSTLERGLIYRLTINDSLKSATGAPFLQRAGGDADKRVFVPASDHASEVDAEQTRALPDAEWPAVNAIFDASCASCHRDPAWRLNPLTYESLRGASSTQTDLYLVQPGNPAGSYLMRKILWDYPDLKYTPQPPPWSADAEQLSREDLLTIEGWIARGARR